MRASAGIAPALALARLAMWARYNAGPPSERSPMIIPRRTCARCTRPESTCLCRFVTPVASAVELLILQHPLEVNNAKGSARLLHLCVGRSQLAIGEIFDQGALA